MQRDGQCATMVFDAVLLYALSSLQQGDIVLKKEQREAIKLFYLSKDVFSGCLPGLPNRYFSKFFPFCLTTSWEE